jgi:uncharacterized protein
MPMHAIEPGIKADHADRSLRDDFGPDSDIDVLVELDPNHTSGLAFFGTEQELSDLFRRKVDINTKEWFSCYFRNEVLAEAEAMYVAA